MNATPCDIVLLAEDELADRAVQTSRMFTGLGSIFTLGHTGPYPHVSLHMVNLSQEGIDRTTDFLRILATSTPPITLRAKGMHQSDGYVDAEYELSPELAAIHSTIVTAFQPAVANAHATASSFRPHVTLTRFNPGRTIDKMLLPTATDLNGTYVSIGLYEMGDNGTCTQKIAEFRLGTSAR